MLPISRIGQPARWGSPLFFGQLELEPIFHGARIENRLEKWWACQRDNGQSSWCLPHLATGCYDIVVLTPSQHISLAVCKDFKGVKWSELDPKKKEDIFQEIKDAMRKSKLPAVDDQGIEWRVSSVLPSLRHMQRCMHIYSVQYSFLLIQLQLQIVSKIGRIWLGQNSPMWVRCCEYA